MGQPELTHYERVLNTTMPYDREAQSFTARAYAKEPAKFFFEYFQLERKRVLSLGQPKMEAVKEIMVLQRRAMSYLHHLTQETLRRQKQKGSFPELAVNKAFGHIVCTACATTDVNITNVVGHMHYHMAMHRMAGRKVFDVSPGLAEKLRNTELRGLTADDLQLPYSNIYITVPKEADLQIYNVDSNWHRVVGIYLTEDVDGKGQRCWRFLVCGETKPLPLAEGIVDDNDALVYFHVSLPEKLPLVETVARAQEETTRDLESSPRLIDNGFSKMLDKWQGIFRWAMNVVLYASWDGAEREEVVANEKARKLLEQMRSLPKDSKKRHKVSSQLLTMHPLQRVFLGRSITHHEGWQLTVRVLVTGHWRNQPYGPRSSLRKLIWIEPFWKGKDDEGPDGAEMANPAPEVAPVTSGAGGTDNDAGNGTSTGGTDGNHAPATQQGNQRTDGGSEEPGQATTEAGRGPSCNPSPHEGAVDRAS